MDEQVFHLINDKIKTVEAKVDDVAKDVKQMLAFKWQIIGGSVVMSAIVGVGIQIFLALINK
jgi:hypothetical protein